MLLPIVVGAIFAKKGVQAITKQQANKKSATDIAIAKSLEKNRTYDNVLSPKKTNSNTSFTGSILSKAIDSSAQAIEKAVVSNTGQKVVNGMSKSFKDPSHIMSHIESYGITTYWLLNTHFSKKIDPEQKLGFNIHTALVTIVSSIAAFLIDSSSSGLIKGAENLYNTKIKEAIKQAKSTMKDGVSDKEILENIILMELSKLSVKMVFWQMKKSSHP